MTAISVTVGSNIRDLRKQKNLTLKQVAKKINKSIATVAKYESGEITIDVETLYEISKALGVRVEQLLHSPDSRPRKSSRNSAIPPAFFSEIDHFFCYSYDGRMRSIMRTRYDIWQKPGETRDNVYGYVNFSDYEHYRNCETTYRGHIEHYEAISALILESLDSRMDKCLLQICAPFIDGDYKWALCSALSIQPFMPVSFKALISKEPIPENEEIISKLLVSREDIARLKRFNMLSV